MILLPRKGGLGPLGNALPRRTFLRGVLAGVGASLALPMLEAMLDGSGKALACGGVVPRRFGMYWWGNGVRPDRWVPATTGSSWELSEALASLAAVKPWVSVVSGLSVRTGNDIPHDSGSIGALTGRAPIEMSGGDTVAGPTIDQIIAAEVGAATVYRSLQTSPTGARGWSYNGPASRNPPEESPLALYERLFGGTFRAPGESGVVDPSLALRQSVLDAVLEDANALRARVGAADQARLDQHMTGVRELELRLARLQQDPPDLASCARPEAPPEIFPDVDGRPPVREKSRAMLDLLVMALACDQTRVITHFVNDGVADTFFPGASAGHHDLTHNEPGDQPGVAAITERIVEDLAYLLEAMVALPEGDGTLLDNSVVLAGSEVSLGQTHSLDDMPLLFAGGACGRLRTGVHYRGSGQENVSRLMLTLVRAMDVVAGSFGEGEGEATDTISEVEL
jgi:hypothetical protein